MENPMLIQGKNLYPLERITNSVPGYFMDAQYEVYSTRGGKNLTRLYGSSANGNRYYTLGGVSWNKRDLMRQAAADPAFKTETSPIQTTVRTALQAAFAVADRSHAVTVADGIKARGWVIAKVQNGSLAFGSKPKIHLTEKSVKAEMERLAIAEAGTQFVSLKIDGAVIASGLRWDA
jgi:hypothetical protein